MCYAYAFQDMSPKNLPTQYQLVQVLSLNKSINFKYAIISKDRTISNRIFYQYDTVLWYTLLNGKSTI